MTTTTTTDPSAGLDIDIDAAIGAKLDATSQATPLPAAPTSAELALRSPAVVEQGAKAFVRPTDDAAGVLTTRTEAFMCRDLLSDKGRDTSRQYAAKLFPTLLQDRNAMGAFGEEALTGINAMADKLLTEAGKAANIPELTAITRDLSDRLRGMTRKYDRAKIARSRGLYDKWSGEVRDFFNKWRDMLEMLIEDAKGIQGYLDSLQATLEDKRGELQHNVLVCNELYRENDVATGQLIAVIAIMEYIRDEARQAALAIKIGGSGPMYQQQRERRDEILEFIQLLDVQLNEYKQRLFIAWTTAPQIRNIRAISNGLDRRLALLITLTIPVFKLTVVQWVMLEQAARSAETHQAVGEATNLALQGYAHASAELVPMVADQIQRPTLRPDTLVELADSLVVQMDGMAAAYGRGVTARQQVEAAIVTSTRTIGQASDRTAAAVLALVANTQAQPVLDQENKERIELPDVVKALSGEVLR